MLVVNNLVMHHENRVSVNEHGMLVYQYKQIKHQPMNLQQLLIKIHPLHHLMKKKLKLVYIHLLKNILKIMQNQMNDLLK